MSNTKIIAYIGIVIALYIVVSMLLNIPLVGHIRLDCGYIVYAVYLCLFGYWGIPVGVVGCFVKGYISDGWIPFTWMIGQVIIGLICAKTFSITDKKLWRIIAIVGSVFLGVGIVSSVLSAIMFNIPIGVKIAKGAVVSATDAGAMIVGLYITDLIRKAVDVRWKNDKDSMCGSRV